MGRGREGRPARPPGEGGSLEACCSGGSANAGRATWGGRRLQEEGVEARPRSKEALTAASLSGRCGPGTAAQSAFPPGRFLRGDAGATGPECGGGGGVQGNAISVMPWEKAEHEIAVLLSSRHVQEKPSFQTCSSLFLYGEPYLWEDRVPLDGISENSK